MLSKQVLTDLEANIRRGMLEAQANAYRAEGALELLAHLVKLIDEPQPEPEPTPEA